MPSASDPRQPKRTPQPVPRPAQSTQRAANSLLPVRSSNRLLACRSTPLLARRNPLVVRVLNSRRLLSAHRPLNLTVILTGFTARTAWLRLRAQATTPMLAAAPKRRTPRCL